MVYDSFECTCSLWCNDTPIGFKIHLCYTAGVSFNIFIRHF